MAENTESTMARSEIYPCEIYVRRARRMDRNSAGSGDRGRLLDDPVRPRGAEFCTPDRPVVRSLPHRVSRTHSFWPYVQGEWLHPHEPAASAGHDGGQGAAIVAQPAAAAFHDGAGIGYAAREGFA